MFFARPHTLTPALGHDTALHLARRAQHHRRRNSQHLEAVVSRISQQREDRMTALQARCQAMLQVQFGQSHHLFDGPRRSIIVLYRTLLLICAEHPTLHEHHFIINDWTCCVDYMCYIAGWTKGEDGDVTSKLIQAWTENA